MAILIPEAFEMPLGQFLQMDPKERRMLVESICSAEAILNADALAQYVTEKTSLESTLVRNICRLIYSLYPAKQRTPPKVLIRDILDAAKESGKSNLVPAACDWEAAHRDLLDLISCDHVLGVAAKASQVIAEQERLFMDARVLSDIRPVFGPGKTDEPVAGAIIHSLRISYQDTDGVHEFFVALDASDLESMSRIFKRAAEKQESLKAIIAQSSMKYFAAEGD